MFSDQKLQQAKNRTWFYEFDLPDGTRTPTEISPLVRPIHQYRRDKLTEVIRARVPDANALVAADLASHEGYFTVELARHFRSVRGYELRRDCVEAARLITDILEIDNVEYVEQDLQAPEFAPQLQVDFLLVYGLIYHLENPVRLLRLASRMSRRHILIETQVFPYDIAGQIEDGHHLYQRPIEGVFGLTSDYSARSQGGSTDIALVPSLNALLFLMRGFGFTDLQVLPSEPDAYEQFARGQRVIVYGRKS